MSELSKFLLAQIRDNFVPTNKQNDVTQRRAWLLKKCWFGKNRVGTEGRSDQ